ncbi:tyrosine-type recombinase/integrase [Halorubrum halodurans]|uniref:Integrase n=1 Tax=Halorubrum halodurans TaxID=1383851 RepID=A0A256IEH4_9EURY|nr:site-specific integrase [Halorubrum halodurans]OYR54920.1 integrase [Halorubrum halodurans]
MKLKPTPPKDAVNRYLRDVEGHITDKTHYNYSTTLRRFLEWCDERGIEDMNDLDSELIDRFKEWRLEDVKPITAKNDMNTVRNFIEYAATIQAVPTGLSDLIRIPKVSEDDEICDEYLTRQEAKSILQYLSKYEYASTRHAVMLILWKGGMRLSGLRALDVRDFDQARPALEIRHRPETKTPLKRKEKSERDVILSPDSAEIISDYINDRRDETTDKFGRRPLISTREGRAARTTIQKYVYTSTRPCHHNGGKCPYNRDPDTCEAIPFDQANKCPGSVSPHAIRRGYVTAAQNAGQPKDVTSERVNMSGKILDKHYDKGSHDEKAERRREYLKDI